MPKSAPAVPQVVIGIAGGSGSGKSWLAKAVAEAFRGRSTVVCHDWYYKGNGHVRDEEERRKLNFDHPDALETALMSAQLRDLAAGRAVDAPIYDYETHARLDRTRRVEPAPLIVVDGILILHEQALRERMSLSVYIEVPDDVRLLRRVRRDTKERRIDLDETLRLYEDFVRPMHHRFVEPSSRHATWIWSQLEDEKFPDLLIADLARRLDGGKSPCPAPLSRSC